MNKMITDKAKVNYMGCIPEYIPYTKYKIKCNMCWDFLFFFLLWQLNEKRYKPGVSWRVIGPCEWCLKVNSKKGKMVSRFCSQFSQPVQNVAVEMPILSICFSFSYCEVKAYTLTLLGDQIRCLWHALQTSSERYHGNTTKCVSS